MQKMSNNTIIIYFTILIDNRVDTKTQYKLYIILLFETRLVV